MNFWTKIVKKAKQKLHSFPCASDNCLVRAGCTQACDKIEMDERKLIEIFNSLGACPDCGSDEFYEGPSGGMSTNMKCVGCGHWFNMCLPWSVDRINMVEGRFFN